MPTAFLKKTVRPNRTHVIAIEADSQSILDEEKQLYLDDGWTAATADDFANQNVFYHSRGSVTAPFVGGDKSLIVKSGTLTRATSDVDGVQQVTGVGFKPTLVMLVGIDDSDPSTFCDGKSTFSKQMCTANGKADVTNSINIQNGNPTTGWTARILQAASPNTLNGFDVDWKKVGEGLNVTVKYIAIK